MMNGHEKSDSVIVAEKPTNKAERSAAESAEPRTETKGNAGQQSTCRAQNRVSAPEEPDRMRQVLAAWTRGRSRMRESCTYGSARGASSNGGPYRNRREFIAGLSAAAWPVVARAQQPAMPVIGYLGTGSPAAFAYLLRAFRQGLSETGYVEGRNVAIEYRWAEGQNDRLLSLATDLVRRQATVIVTGGVQAAQAAKAATTTIPVVFYTGAEPVAAGLVASLSRPGGNLTGLTGLNAELGPKRLELLHELVPAATTIPVLLNPTDSNAGALPAYLQTAARTLGVQLHVLHASAERDFDAAFATLAQLRADALLIGASLFFNTHSEQLATLTVRHAVPAIYQFRAFAAAGGLMSYGSSITDSHRLVGIYAGRVLKGEKPADLPVQQATRVELIINMRTAKAFGLTIPETLLGRAEEVIQ
jgi:putative tryptophan/tyrosine transport system substrate-binding protein